MPVLVDVNEPSQLPPQPHQSVSQQHQQQAQEEQKQQQQRVLCSTRCQPQVGIENTEILTGKDKTASVSVSESTINLDNKENCPPPPTPLPAPKARKRSRSVVVKGVESMSVQTRSSESDTSSKCGATDDKCFEAGVEGKVRVSKVKGERRDISKEATRINIVDSTRSDGDTATAVIAAAASSDSSKAPTTTADMYKKPDISYSHLILHAISQSPNEQLTLREIYAWIEARHPFYRDAPTGWQNSIRHNLSSSKAFVKLERAKNDTGKGCFWALHENVQEILAATSSKKGRKSLVDQDDGVPALSLPSPSNAVARSRNASSSLPKLNCKQDGSREDLPSPTASEPYDDPKSPKPIRTKTKEVYAPSTPPSSPDYEADLEDKGTVLGNKNESPLASTADGASLVTHPFETKAPLSPSSEAVPTSTRRVRRPPQNLSEFVSSEDFKASFGKEFPSTVPNTPLSPKPVERKRSKAQPAVTNREGTTSSERDLAKDPSSPLTVSMGQPLPATPTEELSALALGPSLSQELPEVPLHCLVSVPLSSLSHMTHLKRSRDDMLPKTSTKKWRREDHCQQHRRDRQRGRSNSVHETSYERQNRERKREIVVASENDWSDSDDDLLYDNDLDDYHKGVSTSLSPTNGNLLLLDSSTITYGFEMTDAEYILDFNQGPLFNSVVWPEYSNVQGLDVPTSD
ncbi:Forkhead box protein J3 [Linnemannia zychae]|nr:Forkhead box protein J3 [Linnemannia zychae]